MRHFPRDLIYNCDEPEAIERLSSLLSDWEPCLSVTKPARDAILYEPDGTLYAIALADCDLEIPRRGQSLRSGEMVVIPRGFPVDAGAAADFLAIRHDGPPPDHFRERFIQVRGFDIPAETSTDSMIGELRWRISRTEVRYRIAYARLDVSVANGGVNLPSCPFLRVLLNLEGDVVIRPLNSGPASDYRLAPRTLTVAYPNEPLCAEGDARLVIMEIPTELEHEGRRRFQERVVVDSISPEFRPRPPIS